MEHGKKTRKTKKEHQQQLQKTKKPNKQQQHETNKPSAVAPDLVTLGYSLTHVTDVEHSTLPQLPQFIVDWLGLYVTPPLLKDLTKMVSSKQWGIFLKTAWAKSIALSGMG